MSRSVCLSLAITLMLAALAYGADLVDPVPKAPVPDAAAQKAAGKVVDDVYKGDLAAMRSPEEKRALAQKWLKAGTETRNDPAAQYVLLTRAKDLAADAGDADTALAALAQVQQVFKVDATAMDLEAAGRLSRTVRTPEECKLLAQYVNGSINEAIIGDHYDVARKLADIAIGASNRGSDANLAKLTAARPKDIKEVEAAFTLFQKAAAAAPNKADDPATKLAAGRLHALLKGEWEAGLPLLVAGSDAALRDMAEKDLAAPADTDAMAAVADQWWALADKAQGVARIRMQLRARRWYETAASGLNGLPKAKADQRLKETDALAIVYGPKDALGPNAKPVDSGHGTELPQGRFVREWKSPPVWAGKPELVVVRGTKINITNNGGSNVVCSNVDIVKEKDGSISLTWNEGENKTGYEIWSGTGRNITIARWDNKGQKEANMPPKRMGSIVWK